MPFSMFLLPKGGLRNMPGAITTGADSKANILLAELASFLVNRQNSWLRCAVSMELTGTDSLCCVLTEAEDALILLM